MGHPAPVRWRRRSYASLSWTLPDMYALHGSALSDSALSALVGYTPARIRDARGRAGIPEWRRRDAANIYTELPERQWHTGPGRRAHHRRTA